MAWLPEVDDGGTYIALLRRNSSRPEKAAFFCFQFINTEPPLHATPTQYRFLAYSLDPPGDGSAWRVRSIAVATVSWRGNLCEMVWRLMSGPHLHYGPVRQLGGCLVRSRRATPLGGQMRREQFGHRFYGV